MIELIDDLQMAGPMWSGPIHNPDFVGNVLEHVNERPSNYGTAMRMKGMLTLAKEVRSTIPCDLQLMF